MIRVLITASSFSKIFFPVYLIIGLFIFRDFGISWDEGMNRIGTALPEFNYVYHGDKQGLLASSERYHGPSFELMLLTAERVAHVTDTRSIYLLRHFITFFFFWLSSLFLFFLARKIFIRDWVVIACVLMYVLSPRIFGESFFNSKDLGCLSFFTISFYTLHRFISAKTFWNGFLHAMVTGFMVDIRVTGLIMPAVTLLVWLFDFVLSRDKNNFSARQMAIFLFYVVLQAGFIVLFWPVLWLNPIHHLHEALIQMSNYPWNGKVIFMGNAMSSHDIPWYYLPVWILISIPVLYSVFFFAGIIFLAGHVFKIRRSDSPQTGFLYVAATLFIFPMAIVILMNSIVYDGWRHLYFVYAPFVIVAGCGLDFICNRFTSGVSGMIVKGFVIFQFIYVSIDLVADHPHQHVYFNLPARLAFAPVTQNFDADFWGLSYRKGLEDILKNDSSSIIHVRIENDPGIYNLEMLLPGQRARFAIHGDIHEADYWLAEFRGRVINPERVNAKIFEGVNNSSGRLLTIYKGLRDETTRKEIFHAGIDFEDTSIYKRVSSAYSVSGKFSQELNVSNSSSDPVCYTTKALEEEEVEEVQMEVMINPVGFNPNALMVISIKRGDSLVYWNTESLQNRLNAPGKWTAFRLNVSMVPDNIHEGDVMSAYVWNIDQSRLFVDDFKMSVVRFQVGKAVNYFPE